MYTDSNYQVKERRREYLASLQSTKGQAGRDYLKRLEVGCEYSYRRALPAHENTTFMLRGF